MTDFSEALKALKLGKTVYRKAWVYSAGNTTKLVMGKTLTNIKEYPDSEDYIVALLWNGKRNTWISMPDDLVANDWMIE